MAVPGIPVKQFSVRVEFSRQRVDQVSTGHRRTGRRTAAGRDVFCPRNVVEHVVAQTVLLESGGFAQSRCVEQVLAGEEGRLFVAHVRVLYVGREVLAAVKTGRVVDRLPCPFVQTGRIVDLFIRERSLLVDAPAAFESHFGAPLLAFLGRYHHDAVGAARTPQGGRSGIFQYRDRFDIFRIQRRKRVRIRVRHTVDHDQCIRVVLGPGTDTADTDTHVDTGLAVDRSHLQAGDRTLERTRQRRVGL